LNLCSDGPLVAAAVTGKRGNSRQRPPLRLRFVAGGMAGGRMRRVV